MPTPSSDAEISDSAPLRPRTVAYVTGTRADFGLMAPILRAIAASPRLRLRLYATGMHLMPDFGSTIRDVENAFPDVKRLDAVFETSDRLGMARFKGTFLSALTEAFATDRPDVVLVLGDRVEMLCVASACLYLGIPTAHVHGGDVSSTVDDAARHAITKLAQVHLPATEEAAERIRKMGEEPERIHVVGAPALDVILHEPLPSREDVLGRIGLNPTEPFALVTQHPVSETCEEAARQMEETLAAVKASGLAAVITYPNADAGARDMIRVIEASRAHPAFRIVPSLPHRDFLALEREAAVWIGNSSAGVIESASFKTPVVNVGNRQRGRLRDANVIDASHDRADISRAMDRALHDAAFRAALAAVENPWGDGETGPRVAKILEGLELTEAFLAKRLTY